MPGSFPLRAGPHPADHVRGRRRFARVPEIVAGARVARPARDRRPVAGGVGAARPRCSAGLAAAGVTVAGEVAVTDEPSPAVVDGGRGRAPRRGGRRRPGRRRRERPRRREGDRRAAAHRHERRRPPRGPAGPQLPYPGPSVPLVAVPDDGRHRQRGDAQRRRSASAARTATSARSATSASSPPTRSSTRTCSPAPTRSGSRRTAWTRTTQLLEAYVSTRAGPRDRRAGALPASRRPATGCSPGTRNRTDRGARRLVRGWRTPRCCPGSASRTPGLGRRPRPRLAARRPAARSPTAIACGTTLAAVTAANVAALEARAPGSPALERYATLGRLLARLPEATPAADARAAPRRELGALDRGSSRSPACGPTALDEARIPAIVADARGQLDAHQPRSCSRTRSSPGSSWPRSERDPVRARDAGPRPRSVRDRARRVRGRRRRVRPVDVAGRGRPGWRAPTRRRVRTPPPHAVRRPRAIAIPPISAMVTTRPRRSRSRSPGPSRSGPIDLRVAPRDGDEAARDRPTARCRAGTPRRCGPGRRRARGTTSRPGSRRRSRSPRTPATGARAAAARASPRARGRRRRSPTDVRELALAAAAEDHRRLAAGQRPAARGRTRACSQRPSGAPSMRARRSTP